MRIIRIPAVFLLVDLVLLSLAGCDDGGKRSCEPDPYYNPVIAPADFVATIDSTYLPFVPGSTWTFEGGGETVEVAVLNETRQVMGVTCTVVQDTVYEGADMIEDTFDWYAQDVYGNVWYMGEDSREYEDGEVVSTAGSWEGGVDGALPGYMMLANPQVGLNYRQEYYVCEAEDMAEIAALNESVSVPAGDFSGCIKFHEWNRLEPGSDEFKYFCPGVGVVLEIDSEGVRVELTDYHIP